MKLAPCRDCGLEIDLDSRGCPRCARNLDAERVVANLLSWLMAALLLAFLILAAYILFRLF